MCGKNPHIPHSFPAFPHSVLILNNLLYIDNQYVNKYSWFWHDICILINRK